MDTLIDIFVEPSSLSTDFDKRTKVWIAFIASLLISLASTALLWDITQELSDKIFANSKISFSATQRLAVAVMGFAGQIISIFIKWGFIAFFLITILQFQTLNKDAELDYGTLFKMTAYSGIILSLENIIRALIIVFQDGSGAIQTLQDMSVSIGLSIFFNRSDIGAFLYGFLSDINPIALWGYGILGFLISEHYKLNRKTVYASVGTVWFVLALFSGTLQAFSAAQRSALTP